MTCAAAAWLTDRLEARMGEPATDASPRPHRQRPGHLLDVLGEIGAFRVQHLDHLTDTPDGTGPGAMVAHYLLRTVRDARVATGALPGAEPTWLLRAVASLADACTENADPAHLRIEVLQHAAVILAWLQAIDCRQQEPA